MKKHIFHIFILSFLCLFVSCNNVDDNNEQNSNNNEQNSNNNEQNSNNSSDKKNLSIKDFTSIRAIGVGYFNDNSSENRSVSNNRSMVSSKGESSMETKLISVTEDGTVQIVTFVDENGEIITQNNNISDFISMKYFSIFKFTENKITKLGCFGSYYNNNDPIYVLHNSTGKIYELSDFYKFAPSGFTRTNDNRVIEYTLDETENSIYFYGQRNTDEESDYMYIYKFLVMDNSEAELTSLLDLAKFKNWGSGIVTDKYGNLFSWSWGVEDKACVGLNYCITTNKILKKLSDNCYKAINDLVYDSNNNVMNSDGEFISSSFIPPNNFYIGNGTFICSGGKRQRDFIILTNENDNYFYLAQPDYINTQFDYNTIYKISYNGDEFSYEEIHLDISLENGFNQYSFVVANERIYFLLNEELFYIDIKTGLKTVISSSYFFNTIYTDNLGNVCFSALDEKMNNIIGKIQSDNSIDLTISENEYTVIKLSAIN